MNLKLTVHYKQGRSLYKVYDPQRDKQALIFEVVDLATFLRLHFAVTDTVTGFSLTYTNEEPSNVTWSVEDAAASE